MPVLCRLRHRLVRFGISCELGSCRTVMCGCKRSDNITGEPKRTSSHFTWEMHKKNIKENHYCNTLIIILPEWVELTWQPITWFSFSFVLFESFARMRYTFFFVLSFGCLPVPYRLLLMWALFLSTTGKSKRWKISSAKQIVIDSISFTACAWYVSFGDGNFIFVFPSNAF